MHGLRNFYRKYARGCATKHYTKSYIAAEATAKPNKFAGNLHCKSLWTLAPKRRILTSTLIRGSKISTSARAWVWNFYREYAECGRKYRSKCCIIRKTRKIYENKLSLFEHTPGVSYNRDNSFLSGFYVVLSVKVLSLLYHTGIPWMIP